MRFRLISRSGSSSTPSTATSRGTEKPAVRPASARYVRVRGLRRNTGYGISLFRSSDMLEAADNLEFERAAYLRDQIREIKRKRGKR